MKTLWKKLVVVFCSLVGFSSGLALAIYGYKNQHWTMYQPSEGVNMGRWQWGSDWSPGLAIVMIALFTLMGYTVGKLPSAYTEDLEYRCLHKNNIKKRTERSSPSEAGFKFFICGFVPTIVAGLISVHMLVVGSPKQASLEESGRVFITYLWTFPLSIVVLLILSIIVFAIKRAIEKKRKNN